MSSLPWAPVAYFRTFYRDPFGPQNEICQGSGSRNGTCYTKEECSDKGEHHFDQLFSLFNPSRTPLFPTGGTSSGSCAAGYGVCCVCKWSKAYPYTKTIQRQFVIFKPVTSLSYKAYRGFLICLLFSYISSYLVMWWLFKWELHAYCAIVDIITLRCLHIQNMPLQQQHLQDQARFHGAIDRNKIDAVESM